MTEITIKGDFSLKDVELREFVDKIWTKIDTINERTKAHTIYIRDFEKRIKKLEKKK